MERPLENGDESPDSQGHATDWRFAVCSFRDAWEEEEPASQMHVKDPGPPRPPAGATQDEELQGSPLSRKLQLPPAADELGDAQRGTVERSSVVSEEPGPSGVESLLCP
ncbi:PLEKHG4 isoform 5, partial [Pongo abelii]